METRLRQTNVISELATATVRAKSQALSLAAKHNPCPGGAGCVIARRCTALPRTEERDKSAIQGAYARRGNV